MVMVVVCFFGGDKFVIRVVVEGWMLVLREVQVM